MWIKFNEGMDWRKPLGVPAGAVLFRKMREKTRKGLCCERRPTAEAVAIDIDGGRLFWGVEAVAPDRQTAVCQTDAKSAALAGADEWRLL